MPCVVLFEHPLPTTRYNPVENGIPPFPPVSIRCSPNENGIPPFSARINTMQPQENCTHLFRPCRYGGAPRKRASLFRPCQYRAAPRKRHVLFAPCRTLRRSPRKRRIRTPPSRACCSSVVAVRFSSVESFQPTRRFEFPLIKPLHHFLPYD